MRAKRAKQYRKLMHHYHLSFGFREPYQVLLDAALIQAAANFKMKLGLLLERTLGGQIKPMITQCCIRHLYNLPTTTPAEEREKQEWISVAKEAERRRCGHHELEEPLSELECLGSVVDPKGSGRNRHRYVVASQSEEVRRWMRGIAGVPLVYLKRSVMILEPMGAVSERVREGEERGKVRAGLAGRRGAANGLKRRRDEDEEGEVDDEDGALTDRKSEPPVKKTGVRGPKGPNPLSVKKPKKEKEKKSVAREVEDERAVLRKAMAQDPQAGEKALNAAAATESTSADGVADGTGKRKRKRKPKEPEGGDAENVHSGLAAEE